MGVEHGYTFEHEIAESLRQIPEVFYHKLPDTHGVSICPACHANNRAILPKQPADFLVCYRGKLILLECKSQRNAVSFGMGNIREHQFEASRLVEAAGGRYYFLLCRRVPLDMAVYVLTARELGKIREGMITKDRVRWGEIRKHGKVLERDTRKQVWLGLLDVLK